MSDPDSNESLEEYRKQLQQVELALSVTDDEEDRKNLLTLRSDLEQLLLLTEQASPGPSGPKNIDDEYALFMSELADESPLGDNIKEELKSLEGTMCRAPHRHTWGTIVYHNALVCSVLPGEDVQVKVLFVNPTHKEMLPCPYFFDTECKFSDEKCRYSHGEVVPFAELEEYEAPNFGDLGVGSFVLAKCADRLWRRATVKRVFSEKCVVRFDEKGDEIETELGDVLPTDGAEVESETDDVVEPEDVINMSLMITPASDKMGDWEKYTKGFGSKMMARMGYVVGTGLGKDAAGRLDPVTAVVLPAGKSLDHCMHLRERAGGDKNLFSVERRLKRLQKRQELRNQKNYERELKKVDVFTFINNSLAGSKPECPAVLKQTHRRQIKGESSRNLNVEALKVEDAVKSVQREIFKIKESLSRHRDPKSQIHRELTRKLGVAELELGTLRTKAVNIQNEKSVREDKRKMTVF